MKKIKTSKNELKELIKESIREVLNELNDNDDNSILIHFKNIMSKISKAEIEQMFNVGFRMKMYFPTVASPLYKDKNSIIENEAISIPLEKVKKEIIKNMALMINNFL